MGHLNRLSVTEMLAWAIFSSAPVPADPPLARIHLSELPVCFDRRVKKGVRQAGAPSAMVHFCALSSVLQARQGRFPLPVLGQVAVHGPFCLGVHRSNTSFLYKKKEKKKEKLHIYVYT